MIKLPYTSTCGQNIIRILFLDENVSRGEPAVDQLHVIFEHKLLSFPKTLRGHPDDAVIQFAAKKSTGLVTRDKFFRILIHLFL